MQQYGSNRFLNSLDLINIYVIIYYMYIVHKSNQSYNNCIKGQIGAIMFNLSVKIIFRVHMISYLRINYIVNTF